MVVTSSPSGRVRPLLVACDLDLLDELLRLAAIAGVEVDVAADPAEARRRFATAPLVLVGAELAEACARAGLRRRSGLVLVGDVRFGDPPFDLADAVAAEHLAVLPTAEPWLIERLAGCAAAAATGGRVVAVLGGRGGAGTSVFAAGLAVTAARQGRRVLLVDADPLGGGVDLVLGWESIDGLRWPALSAETAVDALPRQGSLAVLSFDRNDDFAPPAETMSAALDAGRADGDLVVVDLPRRLDEVAALALAAADRALLLVPAELRACAAARRVAAHAAEHTGSLEVVVRLPAPGRLRPKDIVEALGLPLAGSLRVEPGLARAVECGAAPAGTGKGPLAALCRRLLGEFDRFDRAVSA